MSKLKIKKGDIVKVIAGESKGKQGRGLEVFPETNRASVENVNIVSKHTRPNAQNTQGGIVKKEAPVNVSNLMLIDPKSGKPSRVGRRTEEGNLVRYAKKSGEEIKK